MRYLYRVEYIMVNKINKDTKEEESFLPKALDRLLQGGGFPQKFPFTTDTGGGDLLLEMYPEGADYVKGLEGVLNVELFSGEVRGPVHKKRTLPRIGNLPYESITFRNSDGSVYVHRGWDETIECHRYEKGTRVD